MGVVMSVVRNRLVIALYIACLRLTVLASNNLTYQHTPYIYLFLVTTIATVPESPIG